MKENKNYTASDFAHYHAGTMPAAEMHVLEKAALEDPFLADALEGYAYAHTPEADIVSVKEQLTEKRENKKVFFLSPFTNKGSLRIAALFIFMSGAAYFFYRMNEPIQKATLAKNEIMPAAQTDTVALNKKTDNVLHRPDTATITSGNYITVTQVKTFANAKPAAAFHITETKKNAEKIISDDAAASPVISSSNGTFDYSLQTPVLKNADVSVASENKYNFSGIIHNEKGEPVPFASITNARFKTGTVADSTGFFSLRSNDSMLTAMASAAGYEPRGFTIDKNKEEIIQLGRKSEAPNDVVVVSALGVKRQAKESGNATASISPGKLKSEKITGSEVVHAGYNRNTGPDKTPDQFNNSNISGKVNGININSRRAMADTGLANFKNYIATNVPPVYDKNKQRLTGKVTLAYSLDSNYRPQNIKVVKSNCTVCEQEAVRLLQNAPATRNNFSNTGNRVVIKF